MKIKDNAALLNPINESSLKRLNRNDLTDSQTNQAHNTSSSTTSSETKKRRSRTVPTTPKHNHTLSVCNTNTTSQQTPDEKMVNTTTTSMNKSLYWEGPPAHFMLPTHADHCRSSRSVERCPRASKGNNSKLNKKRMICLLLLSVCA